MWAKDGELAKAVARELLELLRPQERTSYTPAPEPKPPKPLPHMKYRPGSMEWFIRLPEPPSIHDQIRDGRAISMNVLGREARAQQPRLPRAPGMQRLSWNGFWTWVGWR